MKYVDGRKSIQCPECGTNCFTEWVDVGIGFVQADPFHCELCGWVEGGCPAYECLKSKCHSWEFCKGKAFVKDDIET